MDTNVISILIFLLLPFSAGAAVQPSGIPYKAIGGNASREPTIFMPSTDTSYFTLVAQDNSPTANRFYPFFKNGVAYQVTNGYTCRCSYIDYFENSTGDGVQLVSDTSSFSNAAAALTSGTYQGGASQRYSYRSSYAGAHMYNFLSQSYPGIQLETNSARSYVRLHCKETLN